MSGIARHLVVVNRYQTALNDWQYRLASVRVCGMTGVDLEGRTIVFMALVNPDRLEVVRADSWQFSRCALEAGNARARGRVERIMAGRRIPFVEIGET